MSAALELFAEQGFETTTVPMIADKAVVGAGTIYRYFTNKEALGNALFQDCVRQFSEAIQLGYPAEGNAREQFRHIFCRMVEFAKEQERAFYLLETHRHARYLSEESHELFREMMEFLRAYFRAGREQGTIRSMPSDALIAIVYGAFAALYKAIRAGKIQETPDLIDSVEQACWDAVRVHPHG
ncbi:TetR family transcriptional regulator [Paenibacillus mucilaginosus]|uniref:Transcriptional regulator for cypB n=1 Tax=Paenibacillus mucilaginosus (strain KNP414) TaxID=1036673 RepID=F8F8U8_PAEMK|nr:TetR family transcriptional regulator [Paenibacillus mucilaginosus]AEI42010.1 transcriptional regulator for cypB [Paenibacillus mucilaginosus KNP414]MCG7217464.1 TetR family transcriptional regulator [Paenibacillus mucilaginosus]WDM28907.1 TetR family transcriptional regulator [Paenibacillus mucilaginosus]